MARSFFERLTGSVRMSEPEAAPLPQVRALPSRGRQARSRTSIEHLTPSAEPGDQTPEVPADEEGQLTVDIYDDGEHIVIQSTVAGVKPDDVDISLQEDTLTIRGQRRRAQEVSDDNFYYRELYWGIFSRSIILPEEVDFSKADAAIKNGLLTIKLPKKDRGEKKIRVRGGE